MNLTRTNWILCCAASLLLLRGAAAQPDLIVSELRVDVTPVVRGDLVGVSGRVTNQSDKAKAAPTSVRLYLTHHGSTPHVEKDWPLATITVPRLAAPGQPERHLDEGDRREPLRRPYRTSSTGAALLASSSFPVAASNTTNGVGA